MSVLPVWTPLLAAVFGALSAGFFQTIVGICDRRRENEAVLVAIASEVDALCRLLRHQKYLSDTREILHELENNKITSANYVVEIRNDYFSVFHALSSKLGQLKPDNASLIVKFYAYCKSIIDSTRPDGIASQSRGKDESIIALRALVCLLTVVLDIGDRIVQMPKSSLAGDVLSQ